MALGDVNEHGDYAISNVHWHVTKCNAMVYLETVKCRAILTVDSWYLMKLLGKTYIVSSRNERGSFQEGKILITIWFG